MPPHASPQVLLANALNISINTLVLVNYSSYIVLTFEFQSINFLIMPESQDLSTIEADIYRIDNELIDDETEAFIEDIVVESFSGENAHNHAYNEVTLNQEISSNSEYHLKLFVVEADNERSPDWLDFIREIVPEDNHEEIEHLKRRFPSFVLFIYTQEVIYAIPKGQGRHVFSKYIQENFGIEVLERLVDGGNSELRAASERGVLGQILAQSKFFKPNYKFDDERSFGTFYRSVEAFISQDRLRASLGIETDRGSLLISGQNTLKIRGQLTIEELVERIRLIEELLILPKIFEINKFQVVKPGILRRNYGGELLSTILENSLSETVYDDFEQGEQIEIYHPDIFRYLGSEKMKFINIPDDNSSFISWGQRITLQRVLTSLGKTVNSQQEFDDTIFNILGAFTLEDGTTSNAMRLNDWLTGEVTYNGKNYFKFDGRWFTYENSFMTDLNNGIESLLTKLGPHEVLNNWNYSRFRTIDRYTNEYQYNLTFKLRPGMVVCDRATLDNIEICDFFKIEGDQVTLYHVKNGWGQSVRVTCNQISNGARLLASLRLNSNRTKMRTYHSRVRNKSYAGEDLDVNLFYQLLTIPKVKFCMVYGTSENIPRDQEIRDSQSNLAKLNVLQCEFELRANYGFDFDIIKVRLT